MSRPTTYAEWYKRLSSGDRFKQRDLTTTRPSIYSLKKVSDNWGAHQLYLDGYCIPVPGILVFIMKDYIHRIEASDTGICTESNLFFVELEFID